MKWTQKVKYVNVTPPAAIVDDASYTTTVVDTAGYGHCTFIFSLGASDIAMAALKVQESDSSNMSSPSDITGTVFGTSANDTGSTSALPSGTDDNKLYAIEIDLNGRKRYLDVVATAGDGSAGTYASCIAILSEAKEAPYTAAGSGFDERLVVGA